MRYDLHGLAQIVSAALLGDDLLIDAAGRQVVVASELGVGKALVVAEIEVGFGAVIGDKNLAMLERRHGARIDVQIGIEFQQSDLQPARLQQASDGSRSQTFT